MASASAVVSNFRVERSVDGDVALIVKTLPTGHGDGGLFVALAAGLYLTAVLGSLDPNVRSAGQPVLMALLGFFVLGGFAFKIFVAWAARKTSGSVTISPRTRTMSHQGLQALFPWQRFQLPDDAVLVLDAVTIRRAVDSSAIESMSGSPRMVAIRRVDGSDWKIIAPTNRVALALEAKLKGLIQSVSA